VRFGVQQIAAATNKKEILWCSPWRLDENTRKVIQQLAILPIALRGEGVAAHRSKLIVARRSWAINLSCCLPDEVALQWRPRLSAGSPR
jgi:hypothetical protein